MNREEILKEIEAFAYQLVSIEGIEKILELQPGEIESNPDFKSAFQAGQLRSEADIWKSIQGLAASGSGPAQELALKRINAIRIKSKQNE